MTKERSAAVFAFILVYLPLCAVAEAQTMSTEEAEAYLAELHRQAMLAKQRPENTKVLEWNSKVQVLAWKSKLLKDGKVRADSDHTGPYPAAVK
jgi:hypothetical protein